MAFVIRKFHDTKTLGEKLHEMRRAANITLSDMAAKTKIQRQYLDAFEKGRYDLLPEPIYARNFLKTYVTALKGDVTYFLEQFEQEHGTCDFLKRARLPRQRTRAIQFFMANRYLKTVVIASLSLMVLTYLGTQVYSIINPPELFVLNPEDGFVTTQAIITVSGKTEDGSTILINDNEVILEKDGLFSSDIILEDGLNVIRIEGSKRYSRSTTLHRRVIFQKEEIIVQQLGSWITSR